MTSVTRPHAYEAVTESGLYRSLNQRLLTFAALPPGARVLDLGCGTGSLAELAVERGDLEVVAADPDPEMVAAARARLGPGVEVIEASAATFASFVEAGSLDAVLLANAIHLVPDIDALLADAGRVLRPGGTVAFNTAFFDGAGDPADQPLYWRLVLDARKHVRRDRSARRDRPLAKRALDADVYRSALAAAGFTQIDIATETVELPADLLSAIVSSPMFAGGALPGADPDQAARALVQALHRLVRARPGVRVRRRWLFATARSPQEVSTE